MIVIVGSIEFFETAGLVCRHAQKAGVAGDAKWVHRFGNSFNGGDNAVGSLESPEFRLDKPYLNLLVGGGGWDATLVALIVDGNRVREARGPNTQSGGAETLNWHSWGISDFAGKQERIRIIDERRGG